MFIEKIITQTEYTRKSKLGKEHRYYRKKTELVFRCDECDSLFSRDLKKMNHKRISNNYFHVCGNCDSKRFAQRKGIERKKIWDLPASVELPVSKY
jgi:Zn finger protein HypA/HybF involved in hydrogenase expression